ncbi:MAG: HAD-IIA family hydrolase [Anaerolineales bacterium]|nr:HAD-IIA family hydrolase [Anaerolineales bacterium]
MLLPTSVKSLILDMDGVLWKADAPIGDLPAIFARIRARGLKVAFATNNGTRTPEEYVERLAGFGVTIQPWQVVTSSLALAELLYQHFNLRGLGVFAIGEAGVMTALREKDFEPLSVEEAERAQAVVMGIDRQINFVKMREATLLVRRGLPFYATNPDKTFPTPRGEIPGAGAWISVVVTATGVEPIFAGKPAPYLLELARERLGTSKEETLVVGDRLETDIAGGQAAGMPVALVLSGVSTREEGEAWRPGIDVVAEDLGELVK